MLVFPKAKINIGLHVVAKREDGFHNLESVFYPIALCDMLELVPDKSGAKGKISIEYAGIEIPGDPEQNLCVKAYRMLDEQYGLPAAKAFLYKKIPMGAGLGGGSADAAFFLQLMNIVFELGMKKEQLLEYAGRLGSDCPFFIENKPVYAIERGDKLTPSSLDLSGYYIVIVHPGIHVNTATAFKGIEPQKPVYDLYKLVTDHPVDDWKNFVSNDFEQTIFPAYPQIKQIKEDLYELGAIYASMSGSGSAVYGIFRSEMELNDCFKDYFVWNSKLI